MMEFERGIEKFLREKEPKSRIHYSISYIATIEKQEKENKKYKHVQSVFYFILFNIEIDSINKR